MDTGTALAVATLIILGNGGVLALAQRNFSAALRRTANFWQAGTALIAAGCAVFTFSSHLPLIAAVTVANGFLMFGLAAYWRALRQFYHYPPRAWPWYPAIAGTLGVLWFVAVEPNTKIRIMIVSAAWLVLMGGSLKTLMAQVDRDETMSRMVLVNVYAAVLLLTAFRGVYYGLLDLAADFSVVDNSSWMNMATAMLAIVLPIIGTTAFVLLCSDRTRRRSELRAAIDAPESAGAHGGAEAAADAVNGASKRADEANRQKTETLSYIGHDLRAPLATIVGYTRLLSRTGTPEQVEHIRAIERSASYQLTLIDEILEYARHELKPLDIRSEPVRLAVLLDDVIHLANSLSLQENNRFEFQARTPLPALVSTDPRRLLQVLLNLISNAAKFTRDGFIQLTVGAEVKGAGGAVLSFAVTDSGVGIDPRFQASIFKAFEQIDKRPGSAGLGLYIAQRIVANLGGELRVESSPGKGSRFSFDVPVRRLSTEVAVPGAAKPVEAADRTAAPAKAPPEGACVDLATFARHGQLSEIENWLQQQWLPVYADCQGFFDEVRDALQRLDFEYIESKALSGMTCTDTAR